MPAPTTGEAPEAIKARGAFYTPPAIASFLAAWAIRSRDDRTLEPSCGDGIFLAAAQRRYAELGRTHLGQQLIGVELDAGEADKARLIAPSATVHNRSFFDLSPELIGRVDAAVGNPPYIRYHQWAGASRQGGIIRAAEQGVRLSSLASSWAPFVVHAASFLSDRGRLALVLPAELLHTDYASPIRDFLSRRFGSVVLIAFDRLVFADAQVDAVLLLASNDDDDGLRAIRVPDEVALGELVVPARPTAGNGNGHPDGRWSASIDHDVAELYAGLVASRRYQRLGDVASVDIGYVSGANHYFVLSPLEAKRRGLPSKVLLPTVKRPSDLRGLSVRDTETQLLFRPDAILGPGQGAISRYLAEGEAAGIDQRYKPRHRKPWYRVPLPRQVGDLLLPYMSHHPPVLVVNEGRAVSTNLVHSVRLTVPTVEARALSACSLSSLWALSVEVEGRAYGGGVLKLETREAERVLVPRLDSGMTAELAASFEQLDDLVRSGRRAEATAAVDAMLGLPSSEFIRAASVFRRRRQGRKSTGQKK